MKECPNCRKFLSEIKQYDVLLDVCQECRGVWLDRGELEKILSLVRSETAREESPKELYGSYRENDRHHKARDGRYSDHYKKKNKLAEIFDLFD